MIEVSHLTKRYGSRLAVDDVSFTVEDGVIYGLLGPNGAGKSTLIKVLTGVHQADEGQIYVDHLSLSVSCHIGPGSLALAATKRM